MKRKAVFIDRDGVINVPIDRGNDCIVQGKKVRYTAPWTFNEFKLFDDISETLQALGDAGYVRIVVTNQPDLAYGLLPFKEHEKITAHLRSLPLDDLYFCPHGRNEGCTCRKPKPGMLIEAGKKWDVDLSSSYMIGDNESDIEAGRAAGCKTVFISETENVISKHADHTAKNLSEAAEYILRL